MTIDYQTLLDWKIPQAEQTYTVRDTMLYALGTGLGHDPLDENQLRFVYEKEFVAQRTATPASAVAELYRTRGLSTDTAVEAGYVVNLGLQIIKGLSAERRIRRTQSRLSSPRSSCSRMSSRSA